MPFASLHGQTGGTCVPIAERGKRTLGCYITAREELGRLPRDSALYWHIDRFASKASAQTAKGPRGTVVSSLRQTWLFTIADSAWHSAQGRTRGADRPPSPGEGRQLCRRIYGRGLRARHALPSSPPPWESRPGDTLVGEQCLETPQGKLVQQAGGPGVLVPGGLPMMLTGTGTKIRESLVLILQDATKPRSMLATDWTPTGLCRP